MAVPSTYLVECWVRWAKAKALCTPCWRAANPGQSTEEWHATERFEREARLDPLDSHNEKQTAYAHRVRARALESANVLYQGADDRFEQEVLVGARGIRSAQWWLDNFADAIQADNLSPENVVELVQDPGEDDETMLYENPF